MFRRFGNGFLKIYRAPTDLHRVISGGVLSVFVSHVIHVYHLPTETVYLPVHFVLFALVAIIAGSKALWSVFSSELNFILYARQGLMILFAALAHRLFYGSETAGSFFFDVVSVMLASFFLPFIFAAMTPAQMIKSVKDWQEMRKKKGLILHMNSKAAGE